MRICLSLILMLLVPACGQGKADRADNGLDANLAARQPLGNDSLAAAPMPPPSPQPPPPPPQEPINAAAASAATPGCGTTQVVSQPSMCPGPCVSMPGQIGCMPTMQACPRAIVIPAAPCPARRVDEIPAPAAAAPAAIHAAAAGQNAAAAR
jgi:hypothetical protein